MSDELDFQDDEPAPSFETASPVVRKQTPRAPRAVKDTTPESPEAERSLLFSISTYGREVTTQAIASGVTADWFNAPTRRTIWNASVAVHNSDAADFDGSTIVLELMRGGGGVTFAEFAHETAGEGTSLQVANAIETMGLFWRKRQFITLGRMLLEEGSGRGDPLNALSEIKYRVAALEAPDTRAETVRPITSVTWPTSSDSNVLLGDEDYLGRGGGMLFISHAGAGKSSLIADACMTWAIGRPFFGIKSNGCLKSLIIQSEDSDRYMGKISSSFVAANNLTPAEYRKIGENVLFVKIKGITGDKFFAKLRTLTAKYNPDLVIINPAYLYAEGDIGSAENAQPFLVGLDSVNREEKFAYIVVHHTGKPTPKDNKGNRAEIEDWEATYMGFGSSYFANWPRASVFLKKKPGEGDRFTLQLGKGGGNAGVVKVVDHEGVKRLEKTRTIALRYSAEKKLINGVERGLIHWELDPEEGEAKTKAAEKHPGGRPQKHTFDELYACLRPVCIGQERRQKTASLYKEAYGAMMISKTTFYDMLRRAKNTGEIIEDPSDGKYYLPKI